MKKVATAALVVALALAARPALAEDRIALVVGNGAYRSGAALANPTADAQDIAASLRSLGFSVALVTDAGLAEMEQALLAFKTRLTASPGAAALFYFAGHGVQSQGANYLLPVDQDVRTEQMLKRMAISAQDVLDYMEEARTRVNLVFLDACRNNPFSTQFRSVSRGLAVTGAAPPETLVVYSTAAGDIAEDGSTRNSPFMSALLGRIATPDMDVETMLREVTKDVQRATGTRQTPYRYSSLTVGFAFAPPAGAPAGTAAATPPSGASALLPVAPGKTPVVLPPSLIRVEQGTIVWGTDRFISDFFSGYESFLRAVESRGPTGVEVQTRIKEYRMGRLFSGVMRLFGLGIVGTVAVLGAEASKPLDEAAQNSLYLGIGLGVALFSGGMLLDPGVPLPLVNACNAQFEK